MGFVVIDLNNVENMLRVNNWNWHPIARLIATFDIIDAERLEMMHYNGATIIEKEEAHRIGRRIQTEVLPLLRPGERLLLDLTVTDEPDVGTFHRADLFRNYGTQYEWLNDFAEFCLSCSGFSVG